MWLSLQGLPHLPSGWKTQPETPVVLLKLIPAVEEPFGQTLVDYIGLLPKTNSGNIYLFTIMCMATRFPETIPIRNIKAHTIIKVFDYSGLSIPITEVMCIYVRYCGCKYVSSKP